MKLKSLLPIVAAFLVGLILSGCSQNQPGTTRQLTVFAASSLADAMDALADSFEDAHPGLEIIRHYASSSQLAAQLIEGAYADLFASANEIQMEKVVSAGLAAGQPLIFATNRLTIIVPAGNPAGIHNPSDLATPGIDLVLAAPDVPVRVYSDQVIAQLGDASFRAAVYANLVSEETNVRQVVAKVALGEADAGIVYTSDVTPDVADAIEQIGIPAENNLTAAYPVAALAAGADPALAEEFIAFILSSQGQAILAEWGFGPIPAE